MTTREVVYDYQAFSLQEYGGVSRYVCEIASRIGRSADFSARIVAPVHYNRYLPDCAVAQLACHIPVPFKRSHRLYRAFNKAVSPLLTRLAAPAVVHRTYYTPQSNWSKAPVVITVYDMIHELFGGQYGERDRTSQDKRVSIHQADHVVCISESTANDLVRLFDVPRHKISVIYLGYSDVFSQPATDGESPLHGRPYILYVGQRDGYKNFTTLLRAFAASKALSTSFDLVAFGGPAFTAQEHELLRDLQLAADKVVHRSGPDVELARAYRHARAFVYPSQYEGFGVPPLEAMASGCAVVCSNTSSIPEVVGDSARLFDPSDVDTLREALESVCLHDGLRSQLVQAGRKRAQTFSWDRCAAETAAIYRRLVA